MSAIKTTEKEGDVSIGRHVGIGGNANVRGNVTVHKNMKIEGWLDAKNIKGPDKGLFPTLEDLNQAHPNPRSGWWAIVGKSLPSLIYVAKDGQWVTTGEKSGTLISDDVSLLAQQAVDDLKKKIKKGSADIEALITGGISDMETLMREIPIAQETGDSPTKVMSQKAVTDALKNVKTTTKDGKSLEDVYSTLFLENGKKVATSYINVMTAGYALFQDGHIEARDGWKTTQDFIKLGTAYRIKVNVFGGDSNVNFVCFYDKNKAFLSGISATPQQYNRDLDVPQEAEYVRFCTNTFNLSPTIVIYRKDFTSINDIIQSNTRDIRKIKEGNIIRISLPDYDFRQKSSVEGLLDEITGEYKKNAAWEYTEKYLDLSNVTKIVVTSSGTNASIVAFYDEDKNFIGNIIRSLVAEEIEIPTDAKFARFCFGWKRGSVIVSSYKTYALNEYVEDNIRPADVYRDEVNINNVDALLVEGSSLTASIASPIGFGWLSKMNDLVDILIVNDGRPGHSRTSNINALVKGELMEMSKSALSVINYKYVLLMNSANSSTTGMEGFGELEKALSFCRANNVNLILGEEEWGGKEYSDLYNNFGKLHHIPTAEPIAAMSSRLSTGYAGLKLSNHAGWRLSSCYAAMQESIEALPMRRSIKIFRVRPNINVSKIDDLAFSTNEQRARVWKSCQVGQKSNVALLGRALTFNSADNLDQRDGKYDTSATYSKGSTEDSETGNLLSGGYIDSVGYALIQFVVNVDSLYSCNISFSSDKMVKAYVLRYNEEASSNIYHKYVEVDGNYNDGVTTIKIDNTKGLLCDSKITLLLYAEGSYKVSNPRCQYTGRQKSEGVFNYHQRLHGDECLQDTSVEDVILSGGAAIITPPVNLSLKSNCNGSGKLVALSSMTSAIKKNFASKSNRIAIRITAQNFFKFATTRFSGAEYEDYVTSGHIGLEPNGYDYAHIYVIVDGAIQKKLVWSGWTEVYCEFDLQKGNHTLTLQRATEGNQPILIHDISVQDI